MIDFFIIRTPINIEFATFSLLVVYYAHIFHKQKSEWYALKKRYITFWIVVNVLFFCLAIGTVEISIYNSVLLLLSTSCLQFFNAHFHFSSLNISVLIALGIKYDVLDGADAVEPMWLTNIHLLSTGVAFFFFINRNWLVWIQSCTANETNTNSGWCSFHLL